MSWLNEPSYLKTCEDASDPSKGKYFLDKSGYPWVLF